MRGRWSITLKYIKAAVPFSAFGERYLAHAVVSDQLDQGTAVALQFFRADAGNVAERCQRRGPRGRDLDEAAVVEDDVSGHALCLRLLFSPFPELVEQGGIVG